MLQTAQFLAVLSTSLFTGAAVYINCVEHPARMGCGTKIAATVWQPSYKRATIMQASLAVIACLSSLSATLLGGGMAWLVGAMLIGGVVPFTFIAIMPTNHQLLEAGRDLDSAEIRLLLDKWNRLHAVRSALSLLALVLFLLLLLDNRS